VPSFVHVLDDKGGFVTLGDCPSMFFYSGLERSLCLADSSFAAKLARREGVDFILDPMWNPIKPHLFEHIDGISSKIRNPNK